MAALAQNEFANVIFGDQRKIQDISTFFGGGGGVGQEDKTSQLVNVYNAVVKNYPQGLDVVYAAMKARAPEMDKAMMGTAQKFGLDLSGELGTSRITGAIDTAADVVAGKAKEKGKAIQAMADVVAYFSLYAFLQVVLTASPDVKDEPMMDSLNAQLAKIAYDEIFGTAAKLVKGVVSGVVAGVKNETAKAKNYLSAVKVTSDPGIFKGYLQIMMSGPGETLQKVSNDLAEIGLSDWRSGNELMRIAKVERGTLDAAMFNAGGEVAKRQMSVQMIEKVVTKMFAKYQLKQSLGAKWGTKYKQMRTAVGTAGGLDIKGANKEAEKAAKTQANPGGTP